MTCTQYETLQRPDCYWFCPICADQIKKDRGLILRKHTEEADIRSLFSQLVEDTNKKFEQLENKIETSAKNINKTWAERVSNNQNSRVEKENMRKIVKETMLEHKKNEKSRETREENIIIHRVEESKAKNSVQRKKDDTDFFNTLCTEILEIPEKETKNVIQLGKQKEGDRPRPLKICLKNKEDKQDIMRRLVKLKSAEQQFKSISVMDDLTEE